jgi:hypothetical protein
MRVNRAEDQTEQEKYALFHGSCTLHSPTGHPTGHLATSNSEIALSALIFDCTTCQERKGSELKWSPQLTFRVVLPLSADAGEGSVPTRTAIGNYLWSFSFEADKRPRPTVNDGSRVRAEQQQVVLDYHSALVNQAGRPRRLRGQQLLQIAAIALQYLGQENDPRGHALHHGGRPSERSRTPYKYV